MIKDFLEFDGQKIKKIMDRYDGKDGAHIAYIGDSEGNYTMCMGGYGENLVGHAAVEIIARIAQLVPKDHREDALELLFHAALERLEVIEHYEELEESGGDGDGGTEI